MKKYTFQIFYFNEKTREVDVTATCKTKAIPEERLKPLIQEEMAKTKGSCCYKVITK